MRAVNVAEMRSRLSAYLGRVRAGEEILIRDRNPAVAKIVPLSNTGNFDEKQVGLATQGQLQLTEKDLDLRSFFALPTPKIAIEKLRAAI